MSALRIAFRNMWPGFEPEHFARGFGFLAPRVELVHDAAHPDLLVVSCFDGATRLSAPPIVDEGLPRLFWTGENVRPDFAACEFALSFCRDLDDERHLRLPNYVFAQALLGFAPDALVRAPDRDPAAIRRSKTRFCSFVQRNDVPFRNEFVRRLSRYKPVDCGGPCLNNTGFVVDRREKHAWLAESRFVVAFENEAAPGYTTEKLPDALLAGCVPLYWGDPTVALDFDPPSFLHLRDVEDLDRLVDLVAEVDCDDGRYEALVAAPCYARNRLPAHADPERIADFFERVAREVAPGRTLAAAPGARVADAGSVVAPVGESEGAGPPSGRVLRPGPVGFHGDRHLLRLADRLLATVDTFVETGANVGTTLGWVAQRFPHLRALSCEPDAAACEVARRHAARRAGVEVFCETSQRFIERLEREPADFFARPVLLWLDAHGYGFEWPLRDEVAFATRRFARGYLLIDDFEVPGEPAFGFDAYDGNVCSFEHVESALAPGLEYDLYYPAYTEHTSPFHPLRGWGLVAFGPAPRPDLARELPAVLRRALPRPTSQLADAGRALQAGELERAETLVRKALALDPAAARAWNEFGAGLSKSAPDADLLAAFARALHLEPRDATALASLLDALRAR
jgi:Glycosyltransferase family 10 (fucosyltransferase) C-term/Alpha-(1,3)-fucosyltransferase FucT N-terminal domain